jgi:hypothetical protein
MDATVRVCGNRRIGGWAWTVLSILAVAIAWSSAPTRVWAQEEKLPKAEEVLDKSIEAMGGKAAFEKLRNRVIKGTVEVRAPGGSQTVKGTIATHTAAPNKSSSVAELAGQKFETGTDGETYWEIAPPRGPRVLDGDEKAFEQRRATFNAELHWKELYKKVECAALEDVDGVSCYKVVSTPARGKPETVWYDRKTYLPVRAELVLSTSMGEQTCQLAMSDYRKADGLLLPYKVVQTVLGIDQTITVDSIEHNVDLPADRFALPEPIKELLKSKSESKPAAGEKKDQGADKRRP